MSVLQKLEIWQKAGLIDTQQKQSIIAYERDNASHKLLRIFHILACFTIGLGIISVVAANWDDIPTWFKLLCDFVLLGGTAATIFRYAQHPSSYKFEGLLLFFALLIMGTIGLIAQIFNLQSDHLSALLLWSILTAPLLLLTKRNALPIIWIPIFLASFGDFMFRWPAFETLLKNLSLSFRLAYLTLVITFFSLCYVLTKCVFDKRNQPIVTASRFWLIVAWTYSILSANNPYLIDILYYVQKPAEVNYSYAVIVAIVFLGTAAAAFKPAKAPLLGLNMGIFFLMVILYQIVEQHKIILDLWGIVLTLSVLVVTLWQVNKAQNYRLANFISALIALRIFWIYLQVIGDLSTTGIGLIVSGIVLLLLIKGWYKLKQNREQKGNNNG